MKARRDLVLLWVKSGILLIIAAFFDLQISQFLYNPDSVFGKIFEAVGEFPAVFIASFCAVSMAVVQKMQNDNKVNLKCIGSSILAVLLGIMAGFMPINYIGIHKAFAIPLGVAVLVADYFMAKAVAKNHAAELYKASVLGVELFFIVLLLFNSVKILWGRERFRHMMAIGTTEGFTMWFIPQGVAAGNEFMSFPSGHSANAAILMWITLLPTFIPKLKNKETILRTIACIWVALVMFSRIIMGAHFLSDVTMGMAISVTMFYLLYWKKYRGIAK